MLIQAFVVITTNSVRLWTHHPAPPQSVALIELIVVQIVAVALFCPLIDGWDRVLMMTAGALFFDQIAAIQSAVPVGGAIRAGFTVAIWITGGRLANGLGNKASAIAPFVLTLSVVVPPMLRFGQAGSTEKFGEILSWMSCGIIERAIGQIDRCTVDILWIAVPGLVIFSSTAFSRLSRPKPLKSPHFSSQECN
jgi:hypothetical protein